MTMAGHPAVAAGEPSLHVRRDGCLECGALFRSGRSEAAFCSDGCRAGWNNRRRLRGVDLYDLFMAHRFERGPAKALRIISLMNRLASAWRDEDRRERESRRSWIKPEAVIARKPFLLARVLDRGRR